MRIGEAARRLGTSARMLRYREALGLLPPAQTPRERAGHRRFEPADLDAVRMSLALEHRYDVPPAALSFALRVLTDADVATDVRTLARQLGRLADPGERVAELERERALRWLGRSGMLPPPPRRSDAVPPRPDRHR